MTKEEILSLKENVVVKHKGNEYHLVAQTDRGIAALADQETLRSGDALGAYGVIDFNERPNGDIEGIDLEKNETNVIGNISELELVGPAPKFERSKYASEVTTSQYLAVSLGIAPKEARKMALDALHKLEAEDKAKTDSEAPSAPAPVTNGASA